MSKDSIIISTRAPVGYVGVVREGSTFNQGCKGLIPKDSEKLNTLFYAYYLLSKREHLQNISGGSTFKELSKNLLQNLDVPLPPLPEQKAIAEILSTADETIQKSDEIIAQTERLKKGLMQELLTKGIGHEEFKDSEIGRIPEKWGVVRLGDEKITDLIMGQSPPSSTYNYENEGLPFLQGNAEFGEIYPTPLKHTTKPLKIAEKEDILISVRAPVGDVNLSPFKLCIGRGLAAIRFKKDYDLFYFYCFQKMKSFIENIGKGSTFKAITKGELENLKIPLSPLPEQHKIASILSIIDKKLELEKSRKQKFERIRQGLMNDLLTGNRRVNV
ncbi:hypothetical protein BEH94_08375 [Candidatus Altiarchaeales archaeon WOR_SM1_SCG]|nr:hypothetical protein BEH94_08375 [Candidatus Altiarchaeales archaeon WOR_SM1_SCG]